MIHKNHKTTSLSIFTSSELLINYKHDSNPKSCSIFVHCKTTWSHKGWTKQRLIMSNQRRWSALTDTRGWMRCADRCSGVTGSTWPGRCEPFDRHWGSPLLRWGASCLSRAARQSPREENKGSAGQTHACMSTFCTTARGTVWYQRAYQKGKNTLRHWGQSNHLFKKYLICTSPLSASTCFTMLVYQSKT